MSAEETLARLCEASQVALEVVRGPSRAREHVRFRWWLAAELMSADFNQTEIARAMGRHPSTISTGLRGGKGRRGPRRAKQPSVMCSCCYRGRR